MQKLFTALAVGLALTSCAGLNGSLFPVQCSGGAEVIAGGCYCAAGMTWNGLSCQGTPDPGDCGGGSYPFGPAGQVSCHCLPGNALTNGQCVALQCTGGSVPGVSECVCPDGSSWDGNQCVYPQALQCSGGAVIQGDQCVCVNGSMWDGSNCIVPPSAPDNGGGQVDNGVPMTPDNPGAVVMTPVTCGGGSVWNGNQCVCPRGSDWNGAQCVQRRTCRSVMQEKNWGPAEWHVCDGVNERCAIALLDHNFGPAEIHTCKGIDGACAEDLLAKGYGPAQLDASCSHRRR